MSDRVEELAALLARFPGVGPRQAKRYVYYLLSAGATERSKLASVINTLGNDVHQCTECRRFAETNTGGLCKYCADTGRDDALLMIVEKDQDLGAIERSGAYRGRYFVLGGVLTLSGKGVIREKELGTMVKKRLTRGLKEIVLALSATSEGEHTADHVRELLRPFRDQATLTVLGRGLSTGSELEYSDAATLSGALQNRKET